MDNLIQDLKYSIRLLGKNRGFTMVAILALALGIGANSAIFSVVNAVLLRPLPYHQPDQLMTVWENNKNLNVEQEPASFPNFVDWRDQNQVFEGLAAFATWLPNITNDGEPERIAGNAVSLN